MAEGHTVVRQGRILRAQNPKLDSACLIFETEVLQDIRLFCLPTLLTRHHLE